MRFIVVSSDPEVQEAAKEGFHPSDETLSFKDWQQALEAAEGADLMFVDLLDTLLEANKIGGYELFAQTKMSHPTAAAVPVVLINAPDDYDLDYMVGWPDFLFGSMKRPVTSKLFRRFSTYV